MLNSKNILKKFSPGHKSFCRLGNKPVFFIILFLNFVFSSFTQENLIYNGDFEEYSECPDFVSIPGDYEIEKCIGWKAPTYGTSDYFNRCSINPTVFVPENNLGIQEAYNGNGYLGSLLASFTGGAGTDGYTGIMWWEYVQGGLIKPLEKGKKYRLTMRISVAEYCDLVVKEFGAFFSENPISSPNTASLTIAPQCSFYEDSYFMDTINWVKVESTFIANGNEQYITIGNFNDNENTDTLRRLQMEHPLFFSYMYFDAVELHEVIEEATTEVISNFFTPNNDDNNDYWSYPFSHKDEKVYILNRWGNIIQILDETNSFWNGQNKDGKDCSEGVYFYRVDKTNKTGFIQLVR